MSVTRVVWHGAKATAAVKRGEARGLLLGAEHVLQEARLIVPHELGDLEKDSCASVDEDGTRAAVTFGYGAGAAYAESQHEELTWHHDPGRQAKYLETPVNDPVNKQKVNELIAREIKRELG